GALLAEAEAGIANLNARYAAADGRQPFFLLHRRRQWNAGEGKWIGWERKRGKLHELNRLLRGATDTSFLPIEGRSASLPDGFRCLSGSVQRGLLFRQGNLRNRCLRERSCGTDP